MTGKMTDEEALAFLAEGARTGKLATVRKDGSPHVAPVWFVVDGPDVVFMTGADTVKGRTLLRDGRAALVADDERPPYDFVSAEGTVTTSTDLDEMLPWSIRIAERYMGVQRGEEYGRRNAVEGEMLCRLTPTRLIGRRAIAD
jgi:PPOX class probable F420-dependent enzyme